MKRKNGIFIRLLIVIAVAALLILHLSSEKAADLKFVRNMGAGINLGNTLDSIGLEDQNASPQDHETHWGNPVTTEEMVSEIKKAGFDILRVPVTWEGHFDSDYNIDGEWMARVTEIVDYGIKNGMYVILNAHHETWHIPSAEKLDEALKAMRAIWGQVAENFKDYGEKLLFESMNEPRLIGDEMEWSEGTPEAWQAVNQLNAAFVETVRGADGQNPARYLLIPTYAATTDSKALENLEIPSGGGVAVSLHFYRPYEFAQKEDSTSGWQESDTDAEWDTIFGDIDRIFVRNNVPVIFTEAGAIDKDNLDLRVSWVKALKKRAAKYGIPVLWWDNGCQNSDPSLTFALFDRSNLAWYYPEIVSELVK
jgi:endoglucanase